MTSAAAVQAYRILPHVSRKIESDTNGKNKLDHGGPQ